MNVGQAVMVTDAIAFGGGRSPWLGRTGIVTGLLRSSRAVLVKLDGDSREPFMFFCRELTCAPEPARVES
jgi:hypothetical protein